MVACHATFLFYDLHVTIIADGSGARLYARKALGPLHVIP